MGMRIYTTDKLAERAAKSAIVSISRILDKRYKNGFNTHVEGYDRDCYDATILKVYKKGKCVMVEYTWEFDKNDRFNQPINVMTPATILNIWQEVAGVVD